MYQFYLIRHILHIIIIDLIIRLDITHFGLDVSGSERRRVNSFTRLVNIAELVPFVLRKICEISPRNRLIIVSHSTKVQIHQRILRTSSI